VDWGCELLSLSKRDFERLALDQASFELQAYILDTLLATAAPQAEQFDLPAAISAAGAERFRLPEAAIVRAAVGAMQAHVASLASRALFADLEGQMSAAFKEVSLKQ
jgi:hypothetical protein